MKQEEDVMGWEFRLSEDQEWHTKQDPRDYVRGGGRRCAVKKSEWLDDWWISHSPRNDNQNAEGPWEDWVALAHAILEADSKWKA